MVDQMKKLSVERIFPTFAIDPIFSIFVGLLSLTFGHRRKKRSLLGFKGLFGDPMVSSRSNQSLKISQHFQRPAVCPADFSTGCLTCFQEGTCSLIPSFFLLLVASFVGGDCCGAEAFGTLCAVLKLVLRLELRFSAVRKAL